MIVDYERFCTVLQPFLVISSKTNTEKSKTPVEGINLVFIFWNQDTRGESVRTETVLTLYSKLIPAEIQKPLKNILKYLEKL